MNSAQRPMQCGRSTVIAGMYRGKRYGGVTAFHAVRFRMRRSVTIRWAAGNGTGGGGPSKSRSMSRTKLRATSIGRGGGGGGGGEETAKTTARRWPEGFLRSRFSSRVILLYARLYVRI